MDHQPKPTTKLTGEFHRLTDDQKKFIRNKVKELGSVEAIGKFYRPNPNAKDQTLSLVDEYAHHIAREVFK